MHSRLEGGVAGGKWHSYAKVSTNSQISTEPTLFGPIGRAYRASKLTRAIDRIFRWQLEDLIAFLD
jgi:hypothetical protein